jgi:pimeloyl-ACP methyl ester carboxylesterase
LPDIPEELRCGTFHVPENREVSGGRLLPLRVVVLPARAAQKREPIVFLSGGPGEAATAAAPGFVDSWERQNHDVVLLDLRGTGEGHHLDCDLGGSDDDLQGYLLPLFSDATRVAACGKALAKKADLTRYTTAQAMEDLDALRQALGYDRINIQAGSYGTRAALYYIRRYGRHVRAALLSGIAALENRTPLYHAAAAQRAFDELVEQCEAEPACRAAYPRLRDDLRSILERLRSAPATARISHPTTGVPADIVLTEPAFGDGLRVMLYSVEGGRRVPHLLQRAKSGDFTEFGEAALRTSRDFKNAIRMGLLLSVTCSEDVRRIRPEEVERETAGSFTGPHRVRGQMAACSVWPRADIPADYHRLFQSDVPALIVSGALDPVTPPQWGEVMRRYLPNSVHLVMSGAHVSSNECLAAIGSRFFLTGGVTDLDTGCVDDLDNPPFELPATSSKTGHYSTIQELGGDWASAMQPIDINVAVQAVCSETLSIDFPYEKHLGPCSRASTRASSNRRTGALTCIPYTALNWRQSAAPVAC